MSDYLILKRVGKPEYGSDHKEQIVKAETMLRKGVLVDDGCKRIVNASGSFALDVGQVDVNRAYWTRGFYPSFELRQARRLVRAR